VNNNKRRRYNSEVGTMKQDSPASPDVASTDKSEYLASHARSPIAGSN